VITKADLQPHVTFDLDAVRGQITALNPGAPFIVTAARTGEGLEAWYGLLTERLEAKRRARGG